MIEVIDPKELNRKFNELNDKIAYLKQELTVEKEESHKYNQQYMILDEQINFYKKQIEISTKKIDEKEKIENNDDDESDDKLVYMSLKKNLKEINYKLSIVDTFPSRKPLIKGEPITFQCICVIFLDRFPINDPINEGIVLKYQTFRIYHETKVLKVLNSCLELWNLKENNNNNLYKLSFLDNEKIDDLNEDIIISNFLKNQKELKNARFVLYPNVNKNPYEIIKELEASGHVNNTLPNSLTNNFEKFTRKIVGISKYIQLRYQELKNEEENNKTFFEEDKKMLFLKKLKNFGILGLYIILYILLFIFSILALYSMKDPFKNYHQVIELRNRFENNLKNIDINSSFIQSSVKIRNSILSIFNDFYFDFNNERFNKIPFVVISKARISFFESTKKDCEKGYIKFYKNLYGNEPTCYNIYYKYDNNQYKGYYSSYIQNLKYINNTDCVDSTAYKNYFIYTNETTFDSNLDNKYIANNYIRNCSNLENYIYILFEGWTSTPVEVDDLLINGELGNYGSHSVNIFFSINSINKNVLNESLKLLTHNKKNDREIYDYFSPTNQSACVVSFTIYNILTKHYYYISFLYEFSLTTGNIFPKIDIIPFIPDLSKTKRGKIIKYLDVFRLILIIFLCLIMIYQYYLNINQKKKKNQYNIQKHIKHESFLSLLLSIEIIIILTNFILFLILFIKKKKNLYQNMNKNEQIFFNNQFLELNIIEYQKIAIEYQTVIQLESLLIILLLIRFLVFFNEISRIKKYFKFLRLSLYKVYPYFIFYLFFCFIFAIFAQQIWGSYQSNFKYYNESFLSIIEFSISHFQNIFYKSNIGHKFIGIFTFIFYIIIIYFMINTFFGIYLESYRLTTLKHGMGYDYRLLSKIIKKYDDITSNEITRILKIN